ncbi:MAG TPA: 2-succinyl-5-enolpyruvyl-6-hydroxy-3-cyclohexene-1-carboxylic-acid synthase, partial [Kofleriaceae bacterium]|nr:2-succinyl-5-enolpyruvyl-6-hydroxy-3-cyclohexene-1-carboxylic-acid synthase [Kofleriaceae bacterium]
MTAAVQTIWAELVATSLADGGVTRCVVSPGSRSTPLVAALAREPRLELTTLIDERTAAFFALGAARATGAPVALVCTSGTAAAHYYPAIIEASMAGVPLVAITADRPPELQDCGASQTIDQIKMYGGFVRGAFDLGAPSDGELALRAVRRKIIQAITCARGPDPGPVHLEVPLRKPLEPAAPTSDAERALARAAAQLAGAVAIAPPRLAPDAAAIAALATAVADEPDGVIVAGALPANFAAARDAVLALAARAGYPVIAEAGSQLRFGPRPDGVVLVDHFDLIPAAALPVPRLVIQLGAEPVAAAWPAWAARIAAAGTPRWVVAGPRWHDADSSARGVILGDPAAVIDALAAALDVLAPRGTSILATVRHPSEAADRWSTAEAAAAHAIDHALDRHPRSEPAMMRAATDAVPPGAAIQLGNSLPIRVIDQVATGGPVRTILTQRGAAGIDGSIASAAGATCAGQPVLLILGDVSFAHDLGGLLATRCARAPLAILVIDNRGGQIFAGLPIARTETGPAFERHWITAPDVDPTAIAAALGIPATTAASPAAAAISRVAWRAALAALGGALAIQIGTNFANDVFDAERGADGPDRIGPLRAVAAGLVTPGAMKRAMIAAFGVATLLGVYLVAVAGWPVVAIGAA